ncbi:TonB-dependent siderophore receptor [Neiella marina]|uniref:TonB-dependent siderophore receptor n=1 Tax=Neiella holothuriorum TaxID=2870530 RepID=A0ABS7EE52_9GAMM|nr:TonB-dependent siderophore receptor [Neiella holothuriorum]MBW8190626.1 TonB-dependent siderophore receptor [Neiella holothuriorum]
MNTLKFPKSKLALACLTALVGVSPNALADDEASPETVTIVGHKLTELGEQNNAGALGMTTVLETPFSVDVISLQDMELRQVNTLDSLFSREASVSTDASAYSTFGSSIRVRGLALDYTNSFKINGLSFANFGGELPYEAFEQVTLLKGATGYMYGMAAPGGVVNYVTKKPVESMVSANAGVRSDSILHAHVDASARFGSEDEFGARVNVVKEKGDTYLDGGNIDRETVTLAVDGQLTDSLYWTMDFIYNDRLTENSWTVMNNSMSADDSLPKTVSGDRNIGTDGTFDNYKTTVLLTALNWDISDNWSLKVEYDYSKNETEWVKSLAYLLNSDGDVSISMYEQYFDIDFDQVQGIVNGHFDTGSINHKVTLGGSWQRSKTYRNDGGEYGRKVTWGYGVDNLFEPVDLPRYEATLQKDLALAWEDEQTSLFANDLISFNDQWQALVGVRHTDVEHSPGEYFESYHDHTDDSATTPVAALMYRPNNETNIYVSYVEAFEAESTFVDERYENEGDLLPPLESKQYEAGIKTSQQDWTITAAIFRIERGAEMVDGDNRLVQDGETIYQGIEFSGALSVTENFSLYGDVMLLDSEYDKTDGDYEGNDVAGAPKRQMTLQTNYDVSALPGLSLNLGGKYYGETASDSANNWDLPSYTLVYGGASYQMPVGDNHLTIIGTVDNLFDKEFWTVGDNYGAIRIGEPRTFAVRAKLDF